MPYFVKRLCVTWIIQNKTVAADSVPNKVSASSDRTLINYYSLQYPYLTG